MECMGRSSTLCIFISYNIRVSTQIIYRVALIVLIFSVSICKAGPVLRCPLRFGLLLPPCHLIGVALLVSSNFGLALLPVERL